MQIDIVRFYLACIQEDYLNEFCLFQSKNPLKKIKNLKMIDKLGIPKDQALIMGSAVLVLHGIIEKNHDLDLIVTRQVFNKLSKISKKTFSGIMKDYKYKKVFYRSKNKKFEAAVNFQILNKTTEELLKRALDVGGYKFMSLRDTFKMYKILNRKKDVEKLEKLSRIFH